jgi:hypothetical protein
MARARKDKFSFHKDDEYATNWNEFYTHDPNSGTFLTRKLVESLISTKSKPANLPIIYDGCTVPGESLHKFHTAFRRFIEDGTWSEGWKYIIYANNDEWILLALLLHIPGLMILRLARLIDLDTLAGFVFSDYRKSARGIDDFVALQLLSGVAMLPALASFKSLELCYRSLENHEFLIDDGKFNKNFFDVIFVELGWSKGGLFEGSVHRVFEGDNLGVRIVFHRTFSELAMGIHSKKHDHQQIFYFTLRRRI